MTQAHVLATQVGIQPPKKIKGQIESMNLNKFAFVPDAIWPVGSGDVEVMQTTNSVYSQFPNNYGLYKSQLQNLQGRTDASVPASAGNPGFSKTPKGIAFQEQRTNAQDNYLRGKADSASAKMSTKMMNVHMSNMQGADILDVVEEDKERLVKAGFFDDDPNTPIPSINEVEIIYPEIRDTFKFEYDPRPESDDDQKARWQDIFELVISNPNAIPMVEASGCKVDLGEMLKKIISNSGAEGADKVLVKIDPEKEANGNESAATGNPTPEQITEIANEYQVDQTGAILLAYLHNNGYSDEVIDQALAAIKQGIPVEKIAASINQPNQESGVANA
jgi:hypothetical protein